MVDGGAARVETPNPGDSFKLARAFRTHHWFVRLNLESPGKTKFRILR